MDGVADVVGMMDARVHTLSFDAMVVVIHHSPSVQGHKRQVDTGHC